MPTVGQYLRELREQTRPRILLEPLPEVVDARIACHGDPESDGPGRPRGLPGTVSGRSDQGTTVTDPVHVFLVAHPLKSQRYGRPLRPVRKEA